MKDFRCSAGDVPNPFLVAACIKEIENQSDIEKNLQISQKGIQNRKFIKKCWQQFRCRNYSSQTSIDEVERDFQFQFCVLRETRSGKGSAKRYCVINLPDFRKPTIFLLEKLSANKG